MALRRELRSRLEVLLERQALMPAGIEVGLNVLGFLQGAHNSATLEDDGR